MLVKCVLQYTFTGFTCYMHAGIKKNIIWDVIDFFILIYQNISNIVIVYSFDHFSFQYFLKISIKILCYTTVGYTIIYY